MCPHGTGARARPRGFRLGGVRRLPQRGKPAPHPGPLPEGETAEPSPPTPSPVKGEGSMVAARPETAAGNCWSDFAYLGPTITKKRPRRAEKCGEFGLLVRAPRNSEF